MDKDKLLGMNIGETLIITKGPTDPRSGSGLLVQIDRVFGGWIYVYQLNQSVLSTQFVPEVQNIDLQGSIRTG